MMKKQKLLAKLIKIVFCVSLTGSSLLQSRVVHADGTGSSNAPAAEIQRNALAIVENLTGISVEKQDTLAEVVVAKSSSTELVLVRNGEVFKIPSPTDPTLIERYLELDDLQKAKFQEKRIFFLERMLSLLHWKYLKEGKGAMLGRKIVQDQTNQVFEKMRNTETSDAVRNEVIEMQAENLRRQTQEIGGEELLYQKMSHDLVLEKLKALDAHLHRSAGLVTNAKEIGITVSLGLGGGIGSYRKIYGGAILIGVNIGIDFESKSLVFEISRVTEKMSKAITPVVAIVNVPFVVGGYLKNPQFAHTHHGTATSAPGIPVAGSGYSNYIEGGLTYGFPPLIFDYFGYFSESSRARILKIQLSPFRLGFLKIEVGETVKTSLISVQQLVKRWFSKKGGASCRRLYTAS